MARLVTKRTTTTVTEEVEIVASAPGEDKGHRYLKVSGYGSYIGEDGNIKSKPFINLNAKWLADAGFLPGDRIEICVVENKLIISKMLMT